MKGLIFDIQRYSAHDGPGIRTTAFFKGCPLHCPWCHNPESISPKPELLFFTERCIGCLECVKRCPSGAISVSDLSAVGGTGRRSDLCPATPVLNRKTCAGCGRCAEFCPSGALELSGRWMEPAELLTKLLRDQAFYETSGGGVTFSGGETLLQIEFLSKMLKLCHAEGLHTTIDTSGAVPWSSFETVIRDADLFLYDIKPFQTEQINENLHRLKQAGAAIEIRIPVIPGRNDTAGFITGHAEILSGMTVRLLPFHRLGAAKYKALDLEYPCGHLVPPDQEMLSGLSENLKQIGCKVEIN